MISWLAFKTFVKKTWAGIKKHWKLFVGIMYGLGVFLYFRDSRKKSEALITAAKESHKKQLDVINKSHKEELKKRDEIIKKYNEIISRLEEEYTSNKKTLENEKKKEVKKLVEENIDKPDALAKMISDRFGFEYVGDE
tara:strand:+ start:144 stop:557 length:414 start_codon:yes stop_codon:yes gene_type:complete